MKIIKHRNWGESALHLKNLGAEIDIRGYQNKIVLSHDSLFYTENIDNLLGLETFLQSFKNEGVLILNLKEEGLEDACLTLMQKYQIREWFFLDMSHPFFLRYSYDSKRWNLPRISKENLCVRLSEYEPMEAVLMHQNKAKWVWIDFFNPEKYTLDQKSFHQLKEADFSICLVSPELQGFTDQKIIKKYVDYIQKYFNVDAVCTKNPELWTY